MKARFKTTVSSDQALSVGTEDVGDVTATYSRDGVDYASVSFPGYGGEFTWIPITELEITE